MDRQELRAAGSLAAVFSIRLLGLFMIYPVFKAYAQQLSGATPLKIGLALGIYGLSQGLLQIPFGMLSDRIGRKIMIVSGLVIFGAGSAVAAVSGSIEGVIAGRALQGAGAVGSVILATVADLTSEQNRTKAMAIVGVTIGASFMIALVTGPIVAGLGGVSAIFWLMVVLALLGIAVTEFAVPAPSAVHASPREESVPAVLGSVLKDKELLRLDFGVFALHAMLTANFLLVPGLLHAGLGVIDHNQWTIYLPVLAVSLAVAAPAILFAEKRGRTKTVLVIAVTALAVSQIALVFAAHDAYALIAALTIFFSGFNIMSASLPSLITKTAPANAKGTAAGVFSSLQFLGMFAGGTAGGWVQQHGSDTGVFLLTAGLAALWLLAAATMERPRQFSTTLAVGAE